MSKKNNRLRRAAKSRAKINSLKAVRLSVHRTNNHIYAQIISADGSHVITQASSLKAELKNNEANNIDAAMVVGKHIAEKAKAAGIEKVAFDRSGYKFHGRVKALAEAARENGLSF